MILKLTRRDKKYSCIYHGLDYIRLGMAHRTLSRRDAMRQGLLLPSNPGIIFLYPVTESRNVHGKIRTHAMVCAVSFNVM